MRDEPVEPMTDDELDELLARTNASALRTLDEHTDVEARLREVLAAAGVDPRRIRRDPR